MRTTTLLCCALLASCTQDQLESSTHSMTGSAGDGSGSDSVDALEPITTLVSCPSGMRATSSNLATCTPVPLGAGTISYSFHSCSFKKVGGVATNDPASYPRPCQAARPITELPPSMLKRLMTAL